MTSDSTSSYLGVALALSRLGVHIARTFSERLEPLGLTASQAAVLRVLGHNPEATQQQLARQLNLSEQQISELVGALRTAELVDLGEDEPNRVQLTRKGRELYARVLHGAAVYERELLAGLSRDEAENLLATLKTIQQTAGLPFESVSPEALAAAVRL